MQSFEKLMRYEVFFFSNTQMVFSILKALKQFIKIIRHKCPHFTAVQTEGNSSVTYLPKSYRGKQILSHQIASTGSLTLLFCACFFVAKLINIDISKQQK